LRKKNVPVVALIQKHNGRGHVVLKNATIDPTAVTPSHLHSSSMPGNAAIGAEDLGQTWCFPPNPFMRGRVVAASGNFTYS